MEDNPQYYSQCVEEIKECRFISMDLKDFSGPMAIVAFNDDPLAKVLSKLNACGNELNGSVRTLQHIKN